MSPDPRSALVSKTGDYADPKKCTPDKIIGYDYFKGCKNAYAYFVRRPVALSLSNLFARAHHTELGRTPVQQDRTSNTVDMLCPSEDEPGYTLTFCPDGDGGYSGATGAGNSSYVFSSPLGMTKPRMVAIAQMRLSSWFCCQDEIGRRYDDST